MATFDLEILTPESRVFTGPAEVLLAPGETGYLGVLAHHAPLLVALGVGRLEAQPAEGARAVFATTGGFLYFRENRAVVLAESIERGDNIDAAEAAQTLDAARQEFERSAGDARERARVSFKYAEARVAAAQAASDRGTRPH